jgi:hypothetical protein
LLTLSSFGLYEKEGIAAWISTLWFMLILCQHQTYVKLISISIIIWFDYFNNKTLCSRIHWRHLTVQRQRRQRVQVEMWVAHSISWFSACFHMDIADSLRLVWRVCLICYRVSVCLCVCCHLESHMTINYNFASHYEWEAVCF